MTNNDREELREIATKSLDVDLKLMACIEIAEQDKDLSINAKVVLRLLHEALGVQRRIKVRIERLFQ